jgi:hypothetical protein
MMLLELVRSGRAMLTYLHGLARSAHIYGTGSGGRYAIAVSFLLTSSAPLAASVVGDECASPPRGTVFCEDFEGPNPKGNFDRFDANPDKENQDISEVVADPGPFDSAKNRAIRLRVRAGQPGGSGLIKVLPSKNDSLFARWYFKYEEGFNFSARNHGSGLAAGDRKFSGQSGYRPNGSDFATFFVDYRPDTATPYAYSYYRGMYQDCADPLGRCWGDSLPCVYDMGERYCKKQKHRASYPLPTLQAGRWYCIELMLDMGTPSADGSVANGKLSLWLDSQLFADFQDLWIRTSPALQIENLWISLFHHDGTHSVVGQLIDNIVVSTERIDCGER